MSSPPSLRETNSVTSFKLPLCCYLTGPFLLQLTRRLAPTTCMMTKDASVTCPWRTSPHHWKLSFGRSGWWKPLTKWFWNLPLIIWITMLLNALSCRLISRNNSFLFSYSSPCLLNFEIFFLIQNLTVFNMRWVIKGGWDLKSQAVPDRLRENWLVVWICCFKDICV